MSDVFAGRAVFAATAFLAVPALAQDLSQVQSQQMAAMQMAQGIVSNSSQLIQSQANVMAVLAAGVETINPGTIQMLQSYAAMASKPVSGSTALPSSSPSASNSPNIATGMVAAETPSERPLSLPQDLSAVMAQPSSFSPPPVVIGSPALPSSSPPTLNNQGIATSVLAAGKPSELLISSTPALSTVGTPSTVSSQQKSPSSATSDGPAEFSVAMQIMRMVQELQASQDQLAKKKGTSSVVTQDIKQTSMELNKQAQTLGVAQAALDTALKVQALLSQQNVLVQEMQSIGQNGAVPGAGPSTDMQVLASAIMAAKSDPEAKVKADAVTTMFAQVLEQYRQLTQAVEQQKKLLNMPAEPMPDIAQKAKEMMPVIDTMAKVAEEQQKIKMDEQQRIINQMTALMQKIAAENEKTEKKDTEEQQQNITEAGPQRQMLEQLIGLMQKSTEKEENAAAKGQATEEEQKLAQAQQQIIDQMNQIMEKEQGTTKGQGAIAQAEAEKKKLAEEQQQLVEKLKQMTELEKTAAKMKEAADKAKQSRDAIAAAEQKLAAMKEQVSPMAIAARMQQLSMELAKAISKGDLQAVVRIQQQIIQMPLQVQQLQIQIVQAQVELMTAKDQLAQTDPLSGGGKMKEMPPTSEEVAKLKEEVASKTKEMAALDEIIMQEKQKSYESSVEDEKAKQEITQQLNVALNKVLGGTVNPNVIKTASENAVGSYLSSMNGSPQAPKTTQIVQAINQGIMPASYGSTPAGTGTGNADDHIAVGATTAIQIASMVSNKAQDQLIADANSAASGGNMTWADFPYYRSESFSSSLPSPVGGNVVASYRGLARGNMYSGLGISGTVTATFDISSGQFDGAMNFGSAGQIEFHGSAVPSSVNILGTIASGSLFGSTSIDSGYIDASFFGPKAQEVGGGWEANVVGGSQPGTASGDFAGKRQ